MFIFELKEYFPKLEGSFFKVNIGFYNEEFTFFKEKVFVFVLVKVSCFKGCKLYFGLKKSSSESLYINSYVCCLIFGNNGFIIFFYIISLLYIYFSCY